MTEHETILAEIRKEMMDHAEMCSGFGCVVCELYGEMIQELIMPERAKQAEDN